MWRFLQTKKLLLGQSLGFMFLSLSFIVVNGLVRCVDGVCGLWIGSWHMHDALWHLSLVSTAFKEFPFIHPEFSGANLVGYNYLLDLIIYFFSLLGISPILIFFQILPILTAILFVYLVIKYAHRLGLNYLQTNILAFFMFFGSSFSYLATLYHGNTLFYASMRGFPVVTSIQPGMMFLNIQFALSLCTILITMLLLKQKYSLLKIISLGFLIFITTGLKFYAGAMLMGYLGLVTLFNFFTQKNSKEFILTLLASTTGLILSYLLFYRVPSSVTFPFSYAPFALVHLMIEDPLLFYNHSLTLARYYLYGHSVGFSPRLWGIEIYSIILLLMMNFGTRLFGLFSAFFQSLKFKLSSEETALFVLTIISILIPVFFVQEGGWYNTMQFMYYGVFFASFLSYKPLSSLLASKRKILVILGVVWILLTIPNHLDQIRYLTAEQQVITNSELEAFRFLSGLPQGVVYQSGVEKENAYIPALAGQQSYFVDLDQLMVTHVDYEARQELIKNPSETLKDETISYVYINLNHHNASSILGAISKNPGFELIFENDLAKIYQRIP